MVSLSEISPPNFWENHEETESIVEFTLQVAGALQPLPIKCTIFFLSFAFLHAYPAPPSPSPCTISCDITILPSPPHPTTGIQNGKEVKESILRIYSVSFPIYM